MIQFWTLGCWQHSVQGGFQETSFSALFWFPPLPPAGLGTRCLKHVQPSWTMKEKQVLGTAEQQEARRHLGPHDFVETHTTLDHLPSDYSHV